MRRRAALKRRQGGAILVLVALSMVILLAAVGLAIDSGLGYIVKAKLNAAVDAASLAAARAVPQGANQAEQVANATLAARRFFAANYGQGFLGSTPVMDDPVITFDSGKITIDVTARATLPVTFMGVLGFKTLTPVAHAQTIRKDLDLALVLDTSGSLSGSAATVRSSAITFLSKFDASQDRVGLMHFAYGAVVDDAIRLTARGFDRTSTTAHIQALAFNGSTNSAEGLWHARDQLNGISQKNRSSMRVIVFFSDGAPNAFGSYFDFKNPADCATAGTITTPDGTSASDPRGLYRVDQINTPLTGGCWSDNTPTLASLLSKMPAWYNAHNAAGKANDPGTQEFPIVTNTPRVVSSDVSSREAAWRNVNRAARNLAEAMAAKSRDEGMFVFTLGLGAALQAKNGPDNETGESVLKCMANTSDSLSRCYDPKKPVGLYCYAATASDLTPCFSKLASAILRISQ